MISRICTLQYQNAIDTIRNTKSVYFKDKNNSDYVICSTDTAIEEIKNSPYGVNVSYNDMSNKFYVDIVYDCEMW